MLYLICELPDARAKETNMKVPSSDPKWFKAEEDSVE